MMVQFTYRFSISKDGAMVFISHLDVLRLLSRSARRAELPVVLTQGFSPRFKIKLERALKLGVASDKEDGEISLSEKQDPAEVARRWNQALPEGLRIRDIRSCDKD
jgi:radical SAM-linked protein